MGLDYPPEPFRFGVADKSLASGVRDGSAHEIQPRAGVEKVRHGSAYGRERNPLVSGDILRCEGSAVKDNHLWLLTAQPRRLWDRKMNQVRVSIREPVDGEGC